MVKVVIALLLVICLVNHGLGLPVKVKKPEPEPEKHEEHAKVEETGDSPTQNLENVIEYERYLKEVVGLLESDQEFRKKLDSASEADIRSGKIAQELELVDHNVRTKLDELKRNELERLRSLAKQYFEMTNEIDREHLKIAEHLDHGNEHTFEIEDLKKLIMKTSEDLAEADRRRREDFKEYELQKEFEKQEKLRSMDDEHKKTFEEDIQKMTEKHNKHEKVHHPGSKDQLEEVWEKQDHMEGQDFDPKTFFMLHDIDGNNFWDENEVKALFIQELNKVYQQGVPEDDLRERAEEMERMREHVFKEADVNKDGLISFQEFLDQTKRDEYRRDQGWDTVDQQPQYTHDEYLEFERRRQEEIQRMINEGRLPAHPNMPHGYYPNGDPNPQYQQQHPNEIPHGYQQNPQHPQQFQNQPPPQQQQQHYQQAGNVQQHQQENHQQQMQQQYQQQQHAQQQVNQNMGQQHAPPAAAAVPQQANHNLQNNQVYEQVHNQQQQKQQNQGNAAPQVPTNNNIPKPEAVNVPSQAAPQAAPVQTQQDQQKAPPVANIPNPPQVQQMNH
ncbi:unnamed protein product [Diamesa hyperborea]